MSKPDGVHPTALVDPKAVLHPRVRVGAFSVVGAEVTLGADVEIGHHCVLEGRVEIGDRAKVGHGSVLGGRPQDLKFQEGTPSGVRIGADTDIREYVTIHRATRPDGWTEIGDGCLLMGMSHVAHDCRIGDGAIIINYAGIAGHCEIGERATFGGLSGLVPFTRVGAYAYVGGHSKLNADVPPYVRADGNPAVAYGINHIGLRRAGMAEADRRLLQDAYRLLYRSALTPRRAVERIRSELPPSPPLTRLLDFIAGARRGICGGGRRAGRFAGDNEQTVARPESERV
ncbi:MAG: acyl-[acyl-carrier-protein]--UDP-N-acetylglucosamine O-acyltransferase [Candidatus Rokuibacteriota bacterium]|nr:MAG: acyl-[acyl-carrier-protein]--UDP-N-acetylglucosamine O-acyltransferase [Candidatus Rokubacteria bacterium]